jgi:hypothetical protein
MQIIPLLSLVLYLNLQHYLPKPIPESLFWQAFGSILYQFRPFESTAFKLLMLMDCAKKDMNVLTEWQDGSHACMNCKTFDSMKTFKW